MKVFWAAASLAVGGLIAQSAFSATLSGKITDDDGKPIADAMVTLNDETRGIEETVYSDAKGGYQIMTALSGDLGLRVRKIYFGDLSRPLSLSSDATVKGNFTLNRLKTAEQISDDLPSAYHFSEIPFEPGTPFSRDNFQKDCLSCHQLGNAFTRWPRSMEDWTAISQRMAKNASGSGDPSVVKKRAEMLAAAFNGKPTPSRPVFTYDASVARAKVVEYRMDKARGPHDPAVSPDDGLVYSIDGGAQAMEVTDTKTGTTDYYPAPPESKDPAAKPDEPSKVSAEGRRGLHSLAFGKDGRWYITEASADSIGVFNPKTRSWENSFHVPGNTRYPHTIRVDQAGMVWFTLSMTDQIGRLDPTTGNIMVLTVPKTMKNGVASRAEGPYGIAVNPKDGSVWYATLGSEWIGRVDPKTFEIKQWPSPIGGPRRGLFDASGHLWITGYSHGVIARLTPDGANGFKSEVIPMPEFAKDARPAPYSLGINPRNGDIWVNEGVTDHAYRYIPAEKRWIVYPMPIRGLFTRDTTFSKEGYPCMTTNPSPLAAMEGGVAKLVCIHPDGDVKVEARAD